MIEKINGLLNLLIIQISQKIEGSYKVEMILMGLKGTYADQVPVIPRKTKKQNV